MQKYNLQPGTGFIKRRVNLAGQDPIYQQIWDECYNPKTGALFFAEHCCYTRKNGIVKYNPRDYQKEMLFLMNNHQSVVSLIGRQMGKTVTSCCYILWYAMAFSEKDILITSFGEKSAVENMSKIKSMYEYCPDFLKIPIIKNNETSLVFSNGTRVYCRPTTPKAPRGLSPAIIYCDEFAFVGGNSSAQKSLENQQEFYAAISPALSATHGKLFITSTPVSETDLFYRLWAGAINKTDDNNLDLPKDYALSKDGVLYDDQNLFHTKEDAVAFIETLPEDEKKKYAPIAIEPEGNNGFASIFADWTKDPEKTIEWKSKELKRSGAEFFAREYECLSCQTFLNIYYNGYYISVRIGDLFNILGETTPDEARIIHKNVGYKIQTTDGYVPFDGISKMPPKKVYRLKLDNDYELVATADHLIFYSKTKCKPLGEYKPGDKVYTVHGLATVISTEYAGEEEVYDVLDTPNHNFYANDVLVHNCRFIGKSKTLVNSDKMRELIDGTRDATYKYVIDNDVRFYKELDPASKYLVALDPSMGVSGDFAAMQIFEFPSFEQVGEWMSDSLNQNGQVEKMRVVTDWIYEDLRAKGSMRPNIYWTFENNTVGEGFLCALREKAMEEGSPEKYIQHAQLITEYGNKRIGWTTDKRNKATACSQLKTRIENGSMVVHSKAYVQQLSNYTLKEVSYSATDGNHDDLISASLLVIMMYLQEMNSLDLLQPIETKKDGTPDEVLKEWLGDYFNSPFM